MEKSTGSLQDNIFILPGYYLDRDNYTIVYFSTLFWTGMTAERSDKYLQLDWLLLLDYISEGMRE